MKDTKSISMTIGRTFLSGKPASFLLIVVLAIFIPQVSSAAYSNGYSYRRLIDITDAQVASGPHTNFPILASTTLADLKTTANGGDVTDTQGDDIIFTDSDGTTQLSHEVEKYTATTGELAAWVRVPSLAATSQIYMYYGNSSVTTFQGSVPGSVWNTNYKGVWHLKDDPSGTAPQMQDSTSAALHGTSGGTMTSGDSVAGKIGYALDFDGTDDFVSTAAVATTVTTNWTMSAWVNMTTLSPNEMGAMVHNGIEAGDGYSFGMSDGGCGVGAILTGVVNGSSCNSSGYTFASASTWYHVVMLNDTGTTKWYVNGSQTANTISEGYTAPTTQFTMGAWKPDSWGYYEGRLDEVRISASVRSVGWITTEYNNQNSPSGFYTMGDETSSGSANPGGSAKHKFLGGFFRFIGGMFRFK